ncbi:MAG: hypothetical protein HUK21_01880, partial [Fibrobacteraceae bacterium]|nr:hypothetical protein [Fibrobacteraceae bacterium]
DGKSSASKDDDSSKDDGKSSASKDDDSSKDDGKSSSSKGDDSSKDDGKSSSSMNVEDKSSDSKSSSSSVKVITEDKRDSVMTPVEDPDTTKGDWDKWGKDSLVVKDEDFNHNENEYYCLAPDGSWYQIKKGWQSVLLKLFNIVVQLFTGKPYFDYAEICDAIYIKKKGSDPVVESSSSEAVPEDACTPENPCNETVTDDVVKDVTEEVVDEDKKQELEDKKDSLENGEAVEGFEKIEDETISIQKPEDLLGSYYCYVKDPPPSKWLVIDLSKLIGRYSNMGKFIEQYIETGRMPHGQNKKLSALLNFKGQCDAIYREMPTTK